MFFANSSKGKHQPKRQKNLILCGTSYHGARLELMVVDSLTKNEKDTNALIIWVAIGKQRS